MALQWVPCQAPAVIGSALGLVGPVSVYCDWVRWKVWSAASISVWQHVTLSEQIRPWDTLACCWDVKQPTNNNNSKVKEWAGLVGCCCCRVDCLPLNPLVSVVNSLNSKPIPVQTEQKMAGFGFDKTRVKSQFLMWTEDERPHYKLCTSVTSDLQSLCCMVWYRTRRVVTSQQHAGESLGRICSGNWICCHTEIEVVHQTCFVTQSLCTYTRQTSPSTDPRTPGA